MNADLDQRGLELLVALSALVAVAVLAPGMAIALVCLLGLPKAYKYGSRSSRRRGTVLIVSLLVAASYTGTQASRSLAAGERSTSSVTVAQINRAIDTRFGPIGLAGVFRCIGQRESRYQDDPARAIVAVSPTHDRGVLQVHTRWDSQRGQGRWIYGRFYSTKALDTLAGNLDAAWRLLTRGGSSHRDLYHWKGGRYPCW